MSARSASLPLFAAESPVIAMLAVFPLTAGGDGMVILPGEVRWALGLNPGDLLLAEQDGDQVTFRSYVETLLSAVESCGQASPWVERLLATPMVAVAPGGGVRLPPLLLEDRPGSRQTLRAWVEAGQRGFTVRPADVQVPEEVLLEARHTLPVEPGLRVTLPADVLWALSLAEGDALACETRLATVELRSLTGSPARLPGKEGLPGRRLVAVEPGGKVSLPETVRPSPGARITLTVTLSPAEASLRLDLRDPA